MIKREIMKNVSFPIYKDTQERYLEFKKANKLTHDEAINKLLDTNEEKGIKGKKAKTGKEGVSHD